MSLFHASTCFEHKCSSSGGQNCTLQSLVSSHLQVWWLTNLMHKICFTIILFHASTCFEHHVLIVRRSKLYYTASGIITPIGVMINQLDAQNLFYNHFISCLYMFRAPCAHRQEVKTVLYSLWYHHSLGVMINQLDAQNLFYNNFISCLYMFRAPCAHRQEVKIVLHSLWY